MRPDGFNTFAVRQPYTIHQGEVVRDLATSAMPNEVELGYGNTEGGKRFEIKVQRREVC